MVGQAGRATAGEAESAVHGDEGPAGEPGAHPEVHAGGRPLAPTEADPARRPAGQPRFIGSEIYRRSSYGPWHPLRVPRVSTVIDMVRALNWFAPGQYLTSPRARPVALAAWHDPSYLSALQAAEVDGHVSATVRQRHALGTASNPVFGQMFRRPATAAGASIMAGGLLASGGVAYSPGGGTHHGMPDRANGFCYLNDPVLAILSLRAQGVARVAYVDVDAHHPDGVEHAFAADTDVLLISTHEEGRWPHTGALADRGAGMVWNLPLPPGTDDDGMALALDRLILPRVADFCPGAVVLQCGADAVHEDPMSRLSLSNGALWRVVAALRGAAPRLLVLGGGGYNPWSVGRAWTGVWATLAGHAIPARLPPAAEAVLRGLEWLGTARGRNPPGHWFTTLRDPPRTGAPRAEVSARLDALRDRAAVWV